MTLKAKTLSGLTWSLIDAVASQGITFIVGLVLARLLSPEEFGLIGMVAIFIALSASFINSGFSNALIRKKNCTEEDYSTVFYFNLIAGLLLFFTLFFSAGSIATFFREPQLKEIVRVLSLLLIIESLTIIQLTILTKRIDFKLQTKISIVAALGSGVVALILAFNNFGVWSLVAQKLLYQTINSALLWRWNRWRPRAKFSRASFRELFGFGGKIMVSGLIDTIWRNIYTLIIGKFFSARELGYFSRADNFKQLPANNLNSIISRVTYPVLASLQDDKEQLKRSYRLLIRATMFLTFTLILGMGAVAEPMVETLIGHRWAAVIPLLQLLVFQGMMYPLHALNLNMLQVQGRSDLFLKLEIIKKILAVPTVIIGIIWGIKAMIIGMIINEQIAYFLNSFYSGKFIGYSYLQQIRDILPSFLLALAMALVVYLIGHFSPLSHPANLAIGLFVGALFIFTFCETTQFRDYIYLKELALEKFKPLLKP
ncbi:MAG: lipopolysaccharide biosynthesis protein [Bacteroidales bacterium]